MAVAVFDFDGVLVTRDSTFGFALTEIRRRPVLAGRLLTGALTHLTAGHRAPARTRAARRVFAALFAGRTVSDASRELETFGARLATAAVRVNIAAVARIRHHLDGGDTVVIASAAPESLIGGFLAGIGLLRPGVHVLASRLGSGPGGAVLLERHNFGRRKVVTLAEAGYRAPWAYVYTDSLSDIALLRGATRPALVNASDRTARRATVLLRRPVCREVWR